jgi:hypothetical protein
MSPEVLPATDRRAATRRASSVYDFERVIVTTFARVVRTACDQLRPSFEEFPPNLDVRLPGTLHDLSDSPTMLIHGSKLRRGSGESKIRAHVPKPVRRLHDSPLFGLNSFTISESQTGSSSISHHL